MYKVEYLNKLYLRLVIAILLLFIFYSGWQLIQIGKQKAILPIIINSSIILLIIFRHRWVKYIIKGFSLVIIVACVLGILGHLLALIAAETYTEINYKAIFRILVIFLNGIVIFNFCRTIRITKKSNEKIDESK